MTDAQSNKLDMYIVVSAFYTANQVAIDTVPALSARFATLAANVADINGHVGGQSTKTTGVAQDKDTIRQSLDNITLSVLAPAKAWALANDNQTLAAEFDYPISDIQRIKDDTMEGFCSYRIGLVTDNIATMIDFGLTPAEVTIWQAALDEYVAVLGSPREAVNTRHLHTENLKILFADTGELFRSQLDPLMIPFKATNPDLYNGYKQARIVINRKGQSDKPDPTTPTATLFGTVADIMAGIPIDGATVFFSFTTQPITTGPDGTYRIENIPAGEYQIHVEAINYDSYDDNVILEENSEFELNIQLNPMPIVP